ncbi:RES family NAD+ phosphorylase [Collinsella acetigenes]|nr:RES family NAD+ phosphorylase [Collinsella acetigenes]
MRADEDSASARTDLSEALRESEAMRLSMAEALSESVAYTEMMHKTSEAVYASMAPALEAVADSIKSITAGVRLDSIHAVLDSINSSGWLSSYRASEVVKVVSAQQELLAACTASLQTPAIRDMADRFASKDYLGVYESLASSLSGLTVRGPDIALLGNVGGLVDSLGDFGYGGSMPRGTKTFVRDLSKASLERLSVSENVSVDIKGKRLLATDAETDSGACNCVGDDSGEISANVRSFNVLTSSLSFLEGLTEVDMMKLQQLCSDDPAFAKDCKAGRIIWETVRDWRDTISFDRPVYYHARLKPAGTVPYLKDDMAKAPRLFVKAGRFNGPQKAYYYFSDTEHGAMQEIGKHGSEDEAQVAEIEGKRDVRLIDLSGVGRGTNYFLKYLRFPFTNTNQVIPPEYLVPNFVAQCCRHAGIDGIKYYGSKTYSNYVVWDDGLFRIASMRVVPIE